MDKKNDEELEVQGMVAQKIGTTFMGRATLPLFIVLLFAFVQSLKFGFDTSDYAFLIVGSFVSMCSMFFYGLVGILRSYGRKKSPWMYIAVWSGFLPFFFAIYLFFYRGIFLPFKNFSLLSIIRGIIFLVLGYWFIKGYWRLTEVNKFADFISKEQKK